MTYVTAAGVAFLAPEGNRIIAETMYAKGQAFVVAAALLRQNGGYEYAVLHLLCQGIEVALKGVLLLINYDKFKPELKPFRHNLLAIADATSIASGLKPLRPTLRAELETLNTLYSRHLLRYGSVHDIYVAASTIPNRRVFRRMASLFRLIKMKNVARSPMI